MTIQERWSNIFKKIGPGFITGAADNDPSGIATYSMVGAQFGLGLIWTAFMTLPFMIAVQEMSARIGLVSGEGITYVLKRHYPRWIVWGFTLLILSANIFNIGADLGAMADSAKLLVPQIPFAFWAIFFAIFIVTLEIVITYRVYASVLKWLTLALFSYVIVAFMVTTNWMEVIRAAFIPHFSMNHAEIAAIVAVIGTTISPYLFLWQAQEVVEEQVAEGRTKISQRKGSTPAEMRSMREDTFIGMTFSQFVTFFIMTTAAMTFFRAGLTSIQTSTDAARALEPLAGQFAFLLFAAGIIGTGLLAVPVLSASASYALAEILGWKHHSLGDSYKKAKLFYISIILSTLLGLLLNAIGLNPIKALFWSAIANGLASPLIIAMMMVAANNPKIMGAFVNRRLSNTLCGMTVVFTLVAGIALFVV